MKGSPAFPYAGWLVYRMEARRVSGDEAIELASASGAVRLSNGLGINVRVAQSAGVDDSSLDILRPVLESFARSRQAEFISLPIARDHDLSDVRTICRLLPHNTDVSDGGLSLDTPQAVIAQAARCRIVVTGAYHAAVFALAQGIPAVCLAKSDYFQTKFAGLADQFRGGCRVLSLQDQSFPQRLQDALQWAWDSAPQLKTPLRKAGRLQVLKSYRVYNHLGRILRRKFPDALVCRLMPPSVGSHERVLSEQIG